MLNRRWINYRERQALPITIENNNNLNDGDKDDYEYYFDHIQK
jgi:vacuolar protein sorting-associated protein 13A/C